ncbi:MAG: M1 family metallopeptidase [Saprospiraceae bacterium]|nr:M1 family metallopeptidase [Saprospiraceae bacterium]
MRLLIFVLTLILFNAIGFGQKPYFQNKKFTLKDSLRGSLRPERTCYDVINYDLNIKVELEEKTIMGFVKVNFVAKEDFEWLQIDLDSTLNIYKIDYNQIELKYTRIGDAIFVQFPKIKKGHQHFFRVYWSGKIREAKNAPWDGGFVWDKDANGNHWVGVACEGDGASIWWPCKDHLSDEPDSMSISISVPNGYQAISNGNLISETNFGDSHTKFTWNVSYPINTYNVTMYIGKYEHFRDVYTAADGEKLALDYYVLPENLSKAKKHFEQVKGMLACYEKYLDKYPFWNDGFALVEAPYLGMEHQSAIAYGNKYKRGYLGGRNPKGIDFDYIIIHESGHEYFGNSVSCSDHAEMWLHESFTTYLESVYVECTYSYDEMLRYINNQRFQIFNSEPIVGPKDVNYLDGQDNYFKGSWILHTLRNVIDDDAKWWAMFKGFYLQQKLKITTTEDFIRYVNKYTGNDFGAFFEQYLFNADIPTLEYQIEPLDKDSISVRYRWKADVSDFAMPVKVGNKKKYLTIYPKVGEWQSEKIACSIDDFSVAEELYLINTEIFRD